MLHPDWTKKQIAEEVDRIKAENGMDMQEPDMLMGDLDNPNAGNDGGEDGDE